MKYSDQDIIGEIVAKDYRTAAVFKHSGIDFCCQGNRTIREACANKKMAATEVIQQLEAIKDQADLTTDYDSWPLDLLVDFIEKKHHRYVEEKSIEIMPYLEKICKVHGKEHPELFDIKQEFSDSVGELAMHMKREELILFPFIKKLVAAEQRSEDRPKPSFGTVKNPIANMMHEHTAEGERFRRISELSNGYTPPADACNTYKVTFAMLNEFEEQLHLHIHLENNILFPKAEQLEQAH